MADAGASGPVVRVMWGSGTGPTAVAAYDAALAAANVHDYNLATVSSIVPPGASVEAVGSAPDLGPPGGRLWAVVARGTVEGPGRAAAALGWATGDGPGVLYEAGGVLTEDDARAEVAAGLDAARDLRDRPLAEAGCRSIACEAAAGEFATAVVLGVFGESEPMG